MAIAQKRCLFDPYLGKLKNSGLGQIGKFFWGGIWGGLLTSTENLENFGNSWGGQGPNWGGTDFPKFFWGAILSHPRGTAEVCVKAIFQVK